MLRNLIRLMARRRSPLQQVSFVKFISWNTLYLDFIMAALADVPSVFLYRDPVEVIASVLKETTAALWAKGRRQARFLSGLNEDVTRSMSDSSYLANCYANYFRAALGADSNRVSHINYKDLNSASFSRIVNHGLGHRPTAQDLTRMAEQFKYHSKDDTDSIEFRADSAAKRAAIPSDERRMIEALCAGLIDRLDNAPNNLFVKRIATTTMPLAAQC